MKQMTLLPFHLLAERRQARENGETLLAVLHPLEIGQVTTIPLRYDYMAAAVRNIHRQRLNFARSLWDRKYRLVKGEGTIVYVLRIK